ncbi:MAG TPA: Hsp20/alpha crystallin family protein [Verrucomicrobiae bacterium]
MANSVTTTQENRPARDQQQAQSRRGWILPQVNIVESKDGYVLEAEMPGVNKAGLEILLEGNELTIVGRRKVDVPNAQLVYRESPDRDYRRTFELDPAIDTGRINARMDNGILYLELPKSDRVKPRKINVE